jgi:hypothetical protein
MVIIVSVSLLLFYYLSMSKKNKQISLNISCNTSCNTVNGFDIPKRWRSIDHRIGVLVIPDIEPKNNKNVIDYFINFWVRFGYDENLSKKTKNPNCLSFERFLMDIISIKKFNDLKLPFKLFSNEHYEVITKLLKYLRLAYLWNNI